jgi:hypothetical protein
VRALRVIALGSVVMLTALLSAASAGGADGRVAVASLQPAIQPASRGPCVAEPAVMRRTHPDMLRHQRDDTVHLGVRDARASLKDCIGCHASAQTGSVAKAPTDFCVGCHSYAAVKIDCFECHSSKPQAVAQR